MGDKVRSQYQCRNLNFVACDFKAVKTAPTAVHRFMAETRSEKLGGPRFTAAQTSWRPLRTLGQQPAPTWALRAAGHPGREHTPQEQTQ